MPLLMRSTVSVAFLDLCGFSSYTRSAGDRRATHVARSLEDHIRSGVRDHADIVKTLGDGALLLGDHPSDLRRVASEIIATWHLADQLPLRGVVGYGSAISENRDLYGDLVNSASHALAYARAGRCETLATLPLR